MKKCFLTIVSTVDGTENRFQTEAEIDLASFSCVLRYRESGASVHLSAEKEGVRIRRTGDYDLFLPLQEGKTTEGSLRVAGSDGKLSVYTKKIGYTVTKNSFLATLQYSLLFGEETQEMSLRIKASCINSEEK